MPAKQTQHVVTLKKKLWLRQTDSLFIYSQAYSRKLAQGAEAFFPGYSSLAEGLVAKDELLNLISLGLGYSSLLMPGSDQRLLGL